MASLHLAIKLVAAFPLAVAVVLPVNLRFEADVGNLSVLFENGQEVGFHLERNANLRATSACHFFSGAKAALVKCGQRLSGVLSFKGRDWRLLHAARGQPLLQPLAKMSHFSLKDGESVRVARQVDEDDYYDEDEGISWEDWEWDEQDWFDWDGYVVGEDEEDEDAVDGVAKRRGEFVCNGPYCQYYNVRRDPQKWLEMAVIVDPSVVSFHGKDRVSGYVMNLMNIVSSIYSDPTLGANLQFVVSKILILEDLDGHRLGDPIVDGDSKQSLANANRCAHYQVQYKRV